LRAERDMGIETIGVIGASQIGCEIACAAAAGGYEVVLEDVSLHRIEDGVAWIRDALDARVANGLTTAGEKAAALGRLSTARSVEDVCREGDLLIAAASEEMEMQLELFTLFDKFAKPGAILASSAAAISIADLAAITMCPENCAGLRFARPVTEAKRLEIVRGPETSEATVKACLGVGRRMGMEAFVRNETAGAGAHTKGSVAR
jgi:3-hydroxybutyryl-CoA dehydrogenase